MSDQPENLPPEFDDVARRLRSERAELTPLEQDRIKLRAFARPKRQGAAFRFPERNCFEVSPYRRADVARDRRHHRRDGRCH